METHKRISPSAGKQVLKESKETQCDIDPFENDIFVHYVPTQSRLAGMAGQTDAGSAKDKRPDVSFSFSAHQHYDKTIFFVITCFEGSKVLPRQPKPITLNPKP